MSIDNLDDMIKKYARELELMGKSYGGEAEKMPLMSPEIQPESVLQKVTPYSEIAEYDENDPKTGAESPENSQVEENNVTEEEIPSDEAAMTSTAEFSAAVFSGDYTYPVQGARIVVYRKDNIYAFLESDENGATKKITLPTYEKANSLEADNPDRSVDYFADVFADGFTPQKGLLVSAVGGSDIFLKVLMVPAGERIG